MNNARQQNIWVCMKFWKEDTIFNELNISKHQVCKRLQRQQKFRSQWEKATEEKFDPYTIHVKNNFWLFMTYL